MQQREASVVDLKMKSRVQNLGAAFSLGRGCFDVLHEAHSLVCRLQKSFLQRAHQLGNLETALFVLRLRHRIKHNPATAMAIESVALGL